MNEKLQYATMLEIPVNTCNITYKPQKRKKKSKKQILAEQVKEKLLKKVNNSLLKDSENSSTNTLLQNDGETTDSQANYTNQLLEDNYANTLESKEYLQQIEPTVEENLLQTNTENSVEITNISSADKRRRRKEKRQKSRGAFVGVQLAVIGALIGLIFLTNSFYPNSGLNVVFKNIFGTPSQTGEVKEYNEFSPVLALGNSSEYVLTEGMVSCSTIGSIYAPCNGNVLSINKGEDGKFTMEIEHSLEFKTILSGLDFAYHEVGEKVFDNIPVGYVSGEQISLCFVNGNGEVITNYQLDGNTVLWAV